ncbi:extracellular solute-binding protein [Paenibacillus bouchesdurhonensis]|uniref:extracellular solute-binding protein n=1 Tax=Paenibacillus bouchesdurhonensis TaxID=1870990 RepID=UPI000DA61A79|nr:extracellular solute-binding protein [Paenibacillus bouchesdurhonensis]
MQIRNRSILWLLLLFFILALFAAGCDENDSDSNSAAEEKGTSINGRTPLHDEPFEVTIRHTQIGESKKIRLAILKDVVRQTEAEIPGLKIRLDGVDSEVNRKEKLRGEMAAGKPPDIFDVFGSPDSGIYAREGLMLDLTPVLEELGLKDKIRGLEPYTHDGKIYGLPAGASIEGFFYNKAYFEEKRLQVPRTLAELEQLAEFIKADGKIPFAQSSKEAWIPLMTTNNLWCYFAGAEITSDFRSGQAKWSNPDVVRAFEKHQEWVEKGYYKPGELAVEYNDMRSQIISGEAMMMMDGSWANSVFRDPEQAGDLIGKIGYFNMPPEAEGDPYIIMNDFNNGYGFSSSMADDPRKLQAVKQFIQNFWSEEMQMRGLKEDGVLPALIIETEQLSATVEDPLLQDIFNGVEQIDISYPAYDALVQTPVNEALGLGIQQMISGAVEPTTMLEAVQRSQDAANAEFP